MLMGGLSPSPYLQAYTHTPRRQGAAGPSSASSSSSLSGPTGGVGGMYHSSFFSPGANSACVTPGSCTPGMRAHPAAQLNLALRAAHKPEPRAGKANLLRRMNSKLGAAVRGWTCTRCPRVSSGWWACKLAAPHALPVVCIVRLQGHTTGSTPGLRSQDAKETLAAGGGHADSHAHAGAYHFASSDQDASASALLRHFPFTPGRGDGCEPLALALSASMAVTGGAVGPATASSGSPGRDRLGLAPANAANAPAGTGTGGLCTWDAAEFGGVSLAATPSSTAEPTVYVGQPRTSTGGTVPA